MAKLTMPRPELVRTAQRNDPGKVANRRPLIGRDLKAGEMGPLAVVMVVRQDGPALLVGLGERSP